MTSAEATTVSPLLVSGSGRAADTSSSSGLTSEEKRRAGSLLVGNARGLGVENLEKVVAEAQREWDTRDLVTVSTDRASMTGEDVVGGAFALQFVHCISREDGVCLCPQLPSQSGQNGPTSACTRGRARGSILAREHFQVRAFSCGSNCAIANFWFRRQPPLLSRCRIVHFPTTFWSTARSIAGYFVTGATRYSPSCYSCSRWPSSA